MWYGAIWYPEHWPEERWPEDARLMREAGLNVVRLGEFAWAKMEPEMGRFAFDWLDRAIDLIYSEGIRVLLGTPTAGPPAWLVNAASPDDDCRMLYEDGTRWQFGGRSLCCVNHPRFIGRSRRIAEEMARRYKDNPAVMGWQLDNELGMYGTRCYCERCAAGFREWLREKYGDIGTLNQRLGMMFGGGLFRDFGDVPIPRLRQDLHNPGLLLDSHRFFTAANAAYLNAQADAIRAEGATQPITHNVCHMMRGAGGIDENALFAGLDVAGWDCYPQQFAVDPEPAALGLLHAMARGYKRGRYWMLEQQSGAPFGMAEDDARRIRLWAWQSVAHGAEMILYFRWRTCRFGREQYWRGILDHTGRPGERYRTVAGMGREVGGLAGVLAGLERRTRAAILMDYDSCVSLGLGGGAPKLNYRAHAQSFWEALRKRGINADVLYEPPQTVQYDLLVAPAMRLVDRQSADRLRTFVDAGGTLISTICTATLDRDHVAPMEPAPWLLTDVFGVELTGWSALGKLSAPPKERLGEDAPAWQELGSPEAIPILAEAGPLSGQYSARTWCDHLRATSAEALARFAAGSPPGPAPAVTLNHFGSGRAVYVAAVVDQLLLDRLIAMLIERPGDLPVADSDMVEIVPCNAAGAALCFVLNHGARPARVSNPSGGRDFISDSQPGESMLLAPYDVAILSLT